MQSEKKDITSRMDIEKLIRLFYDKLLADPLMQPFFSDVVAHLEPHLELIIDFWDNILLGSQTYGRNAMQPHIRLNKKVAMRKEHFSRWLEHFNTSCDTLFLGETVHQAKNRAYSIAMVMQVKILNETAFNG